MLEVCGVELPWCEHDDLGARVRVRCHGLQHREQPARIVVNRTYSHALEHPRECLLQDGAILQHIRHAGRHAQVVLKHIELPVLVAHDICPGDVAPDVLRRVNAHALRAESCRCQREVLRDDAVVQDALVVVDIVDEHIQRAYTLFEPALQPIPILCTHHSRHHVEWQDALPAARVAVDVEGDAHEHQVALRRRLSALELAIVHRLYTLDQRPRLRARHAVGLHQLIVEALGLIVIEVHRGLSQSQRAHIRV